MATITKSQLVHVLHGVFAGFTFKPLPLLSFFLYIQFLAYEYFEETKVKDEMYHELREWAFGFFVGIIVYFILYAFNLLPVFLRPPM
jgi:hypothetical protein